LRRMGGSNSSAKEANPDDDQSNDVERELLETQIQALFCFKILLLGAGESGKSTVVKQLKIIHKKKLTDSELKQTAQSLHQNVVDCMKALLLAAKNFGIPRSESDDALAIALDKWDENERVSPELGQQIFKAWKGEAVQGAYKRRSEFWLLDSCTYYFENIERFCEADFMPSEEDAVMARVRTTGIVVTELEQKIPKTDPNEPEFIKFQVVDVGGQRNERKKWMHCFDDVKSILFCVNLAGYNQVLFEDNTKNRMVEEFELFQKVVHNSIFETTPIFLFLNKKDIFETMIMEVDLKHNFPTYEGGKDLGHALDYIQGEFKARLPPKKTVGIHIVSARWRRDIKCAFEEVKKTLYDENRTTLLQQVADLRKKHRAVSKDSSGGGCCVSKKATEAVVMEPGAAPKAATNASF